MHVQQDIAATHEFSIDVDLGNGRPFRVFFDTLSQIVVSQYIEGLYVVKVNTLDLHDLDGSSTEPALVVMIMVSKERKRPVSFIVFGELRFEDGISKCWLVNRGGELPWVRRRYLS
jgi:hypothetical protein